MVRLVFRPYTQVWRTICTSVSLRASIRVSSDFTLLRHSSPSFGSQQICSYAHCSHKNAKQSVDRATLVRETFKFSNKAKVSGPENSLSLRTWVFKWSPNTRTHVRLLGPCFKTGRFEPFRVVESQTLWWVGRVLWYASSTLTLLDAKRRSHQTAIRTPPTNLKKAMC